MITIKKLLYSGLITLLVLLPVHTVITVWLTSRFGHVYFWSGWKELLLIAMGLLGVVLVVKDRILRQRLMEPLYNRLGVAYVGLCVVYALAQGLSSTALVGLALNTRFVVVFGIAQIIAFYFPNRLKTINRIVIGVAVIVALFGILQVILLEPTILTRVGYDAPGVNTSGIPPAIHKVAADSNLYRAQSSLRGPNVLGAYLILPIMLIISAYRKSRSKKLLAVFAVLSLALVLSHSRSAVLGLVVGLAFWIGLRFDLAKLIMKYKYFAGALTVIFLIGLFLVWPTEGFQTVILHNSPNVSVVQSNQGHWLQTKQAIREVINHPIGGGIGSAGPSSALLEGQNSRIAENYFLQIGQETGWLGLALFLSLQISVALTLWQRRYNVLAQPVFAAFIGLTLTNLLLHTWSDEVISIIAWTALGFTLMNKQAKTKIKT